ncbi:MAG: sigma-54-dependent Fis family transcriptional regulator [Kofleriaceae bacterium]|nr:sigma-54-dependent Fis family transcriptional regulator [Kofleriaceae bacterium]
MSILIVDDEKNILRALRLVLEGEDYEVFDANCIAAAELILSAESSIETILLDIKLGDDNGLDLLAALKSGNSGGAEGYDSSIPVIMISGHASIEDAIRATKLGAHDFLEKPLDRNRIVVTVRNASQHFAMQQQVQQLQHEVDSQFFLLGNSIVMQDLRRQISKIAPTKTRVLVTGESGTGKELIARAIHRNSLVKDGEFVKVNCAAIPSELIESELFGHERGAFTGAVSRKRGLFEVADKGTIFLDEIGDMSLSAQAKVLRVLQTGDFSRVGGEQTLTTQCRVVAATNKNLEQAVRDGEFREDLYFRLNVIPIHSPPLRDRADDIPLLMKSFLVQCCNENGFSDKECDDEVIVALQKYAWPGNVRELRNVVERLVIMSDEYILEKDLPPYLGGPSGMPVDSKSETSVGISSYADYTLRDFRESVETDFIVNRLEEYQWNISKAAQSLGIERTNLHKKLRSLGIQRPKS